MRLWRTTDAASAYQTEQPTLVTAGCTRFPNTPLADFHPMQLTDLTATGTRIVEVGIEDGELASHLIHQGFSYLGVASTDATRRAIVARYAHLKNCITVSQNKRIARQNNAELLILNGWAGAGLARFRNFRHARHVAMKLRPEAASVVGALLGLMQWPLRRVVKPRIAHVANSACSLLVFSLRHSRRRTSARRFIPHALGVEGFLKQITKAGVRHAVLRWFETLPDVAPGEDLDLLVDDADAAAVHKILDSGPGVQPLDLYSITGVPGTDFRSMPYYPPYLAEQILNGAIDHRGLCKVPGPREHFLGLAYHALYHKGASSSLPHGCNSPRQRSTSDHDYTAILHAMAHRLGIDVPITLADLDRFLDSQGWRPPHDMLIRLARHNPWINSLLERPSGISANDEIAVFLLREVALHRGGVERASALLEQHGFQVLAAEMFPRSFAATVARSVRGGNWGPGPWPLSGGPPVAAIVARDPSPIGLTRAQRRRYPFLANARLLCKEKIRDAFNDGHPSESHCNVVHSSDNGREALDYLRIIAPGLSEHLRDLVHQLNANGSAATHETATTFDDLHGHRQAA